MCPSNDESGETRPDGSGYSGAAIRGTHALLPCRDFDGIIHCGARGNGSGVLSLSNEQEETNNRQASY